MTEETQTNIIQKNPKPIIINIFKKFKLKNNYFYFKSFCLTKVIQGEIPKFDINNLTIKEIEKDYKLIFKLKKSISFFKNYKFNFYSFKIPVKDINSFDIQNKIIVNYDNKYFGRIMFNVFDLKKGKSRHSKIYKIDNTSIYLRQTPKNTMYLTVRETNKYDYPLDNLKVTTAYFLSKINPKRNIILLFEKESSRYEESASVLYEKLIDLGYTNCYYIINKDNPKISNIKKKYQKNLIYKDSFKHLLYFFTCTKFIGSETLGHAIQLRIANKYAVRKTKSNKIKYIFLQHGVMYMISLDSDMRSDFKKNNFKLFKIVVSSKKEAQHFIDLGGFNKEDLYITGLAKFDKSTLKPNADKIVIMPTWRRWESNQARSDFTKTKYYKMLERIVKAIPNNLKDKIIVLPHPLMVKAMKKSQNELQKYLPDDIIYDDILKKCKVLITDYSSISYDAFYRGSNIIFYWEEKDECLKEYGENTKLMLTEDLAFGPVCYTPQELKEVIIETYKNDQIPKYQKNYKKIVEFHDNKNTERIIEYLKKDNII